MAAGSGKLYLIDGTAQLFRAYFAMPGLTNPEGVPTGATYGFTAMLRKLLKEERPELVAVAWDLPGEVFRHASFPEYKANRDPTPEDLNVQLPYARQVCETLGVAAVEREGYEADDLIATYTRLGREAGYEVVVVASDKDLLQLVGAGVLVLNPNNDTRLDPSGVADSFGVPPDGVIEVLGLMGDAVDNIPGVPGVGEKTALAVVNMYGGIDAAIERAARFTTLYDARDGLLEAIAALERAGAPEASLLVDLREAVASFDSALDPFVAGETDASMRDRVEALRPLLAGLELDTLDRDATKTGKQAARPLRELKRELKALDKGSSRRIWYAIRDHADQARMSRELATLEAHVPVERTVEELRAREPDRPRAVELFGSLGFRTLTEEFSATERPEATAAPIEERVRGRYETVLERGRLAAVIEVCAAAGRFAVDTETDGLDPMQARLVGVSLAHVPGAGVYVPVAHDYLGAPEQLRVSEVAELLGPLLADESVAKIGQNLKYDAHILRRHGMPVQGWALDTMVAAFLLDPGRPSYSMDSLAQAHLGYATIPYKELVGSGVKQLTLNQIDVERVGEYAAEDADVTLRLADHLEPRLAEAGLEQLYRTIDGPLLPVLERMEARGILVDTEILGSLSREMDRSLHSARKEIHRMAGSAVNIDSPKQLRELLFDRLGLKPRRKTAKGRVSSTDAATLELLADEHPIARRILEYREAAKLKGTYVDALPRLVNPSTGRVHTSYHPTGAATGRLSSSDPNLQNIPARTESGRRIRAAFVPEKGCLFLASDYSQVELRVLAHLAGDEELIAAFRRGEDIHAYTASSVFGVPLDQVTGDMRQRAKAVNFGILYGMSETRLAREQGMERGEAREFIQAYFDRFADVRTYIDRIREQALKKATVQTLFGRVRHFPQLQQRVNRAVREQALRAAVNTTIQGTAADLMKLAMLRVDDELQRSGGGARILLQVHDELLLEVPEPMVETTAVLVRRAMEQVYPLEVPLAVDQKRGASWLEVT